MRLFFRNGCRKKPVEAVSSKIKFSYQFKIFNRLIVVIVEIENNKTWKKKSEEKFNQSGGASKIIFELNFKS